MNRFITASAGLVLVAAPLVVTTATASTASTASTAAAQRTAPTYSVTAKANKSVIVIGEDVVKVRGKVSPRAAGDPVVLQQRLDGQKAWKKSGTAKIKATGKFLLKDDPSTPGTRFYRVLKPAGGGIGKGVSKELKLVVYTWNRLVSRPSGPATNVSRTTATIATEVYPSSLVNDMSGTPASIEYTLGGKCVRLRATYALTDASATGGTGSVTLKKDTVAAFSSPLALGQVLKDQETDLTSAFRISFELTSSATPTSYAAVGSPEVLCTS